MVLLRRPPEGRHINDPAHLLELTLELPVLDRLQVAQGQLRRTRQLVTVDLGDSRPGRKLRLHPSEQRDHVDPVQHFLAVEVVVGREVEVGFDVAQAENGDRAQIGQPGHAIQGCLQRDRDQAFDFLGGPPGILGDHLDHRRRWVGISDYIKNMEGVETAEKKDTEGSWEDFLRRWPSGRNAAAAGKRRDEARRREQA